MLKLVECVASVAGRGDLHGALFVVPFESETKVQRAVPIDQNLVKLGEDMN